MTRGGAWLHRRMWGKDTSSGGAANASRSGIQKGEKGKMDGAVGGPKPDGEEKYEKFWTPKELKHKKSRQSLWGTLLPGAVW